MTWDEFVEYVTENGEIQVELSEGEGAGNDGEVWQNVLEELQQIHQHPIDVNTATPEQLRSIPFLSEQQIVSILEYVWLNHGMHTLNELLLLPSISYNERRYLPLFLTIGPEKGVGTESGQKEWLKSAGKRMRQELLTRVDIPFYHRKGYLQRKYRGSPLYNKVLYRMESRHLSASLHAERDAGERGIDSYGGYLMLSDLPLSGKGGKEVKLQRVVIGDYRVSFGQGLVLGQGFSMGKTFMVRSQGIRPQRGTDEVDFMRGLAATLSLDKFSLSAFYSQRRWDATLTTVSEQEDSSSAGASSFLAAKTVVGSGYHRTETEYAKKGNLGVCVIGGHAGWNQKVWSAGVTGYFLKSDKPFERGSSAYRRIYPQGSHFGGASMDYSYDAYSWRLWGETAWAGTLFPSSANGTTNMVKERRSGLATLNNFVWKINNNYHLTLQQRYYNRLYHSFFSSAPTESGGVQNETGGMVRLDAQPVSGLRLMAYLDLFRSPWPRYGILRSTSGWDAMSEVECVFSRTNTLQIRYRVKSKEVSAGAKIHHRLRLQWQKELDSGKWRFTTTAMFHALRGSYGEAVGHVVKFTPSPSGWRDKTSRPLWRASLSGLYFHTSDYDSRVYLYEPNVTGIVYIPSFYGHGLRVAATAQCNLFQQHLRLELKYSVTRYFDRQMQGSGLQTIYSAVKNDLSLQAILKI